MMIMTNTNDCNEYNNNTNDKGNNNGSGGNEGEDDIKIILDLIDPGTKK